MKKILSILACLILACTSFAFAGCGNKSNWEEPHRVVLAVPENLHVEYTNDWLKGDSLLPAYCTLVKEGNCYYVKAPTTYSSDRLEVFVKANLQNPVEFSGPDYAQGHISARWTGSAWQDAANDTNYNSWNANDHNGHVYYTGLGFLDSGYGDVNHPYDNGVTDKNGYTHTATQKDNQTLTLDSGHQVECVVWEYSFTTSDPNSWSKEKFWFEKNTGITIKRTSITPSSANQSLDADENIGLLATYFATNETLQSYLSQTGVDRWPVPSFADYN